MRRPRKTGARDATRAIPREDARAASTVDVKGLPARPGGLARLVEGAVRAVLDDQGVERYAVSLTFVTDRKIAAINRKALGRRGATDVIAFDLSERGLPAGLVGDVYISLGRARRQSADYGVSLPEEIVRLAIHGVLHVAGHRDHTTKARREMEARQESALKKVMKRFEVRPRL